MQPTHTLLPQNLLSQPLPAPLWQLQLHRNAPAGTAAAPAAAASGSFPVYTPFTVLPVAERLDACPANSAAKSFVLLGF